MVQIVPKLSSESKNPAVKTSALAARRLRWNFPESDVCHWLGGNVFLTAVMNVYSMLVPDNEKYYIRSMTPFVDKLCDVQQRSEVIEFFRQESLHGVAHQKHWKCLAKAGVDANRFVEVTSFFLYRILEPLQPKWLRLSIVAAVEHINASLAHSFLKRGLLKQAEPELRRLFEWHFAEEIEHKGVAHNFLSTIAPGYIKRVAGGIMAYVIFYALLAAGTVYMLASSGNLLRTQTIRDAYKYILVDGALSDTLNHFIRYLNPKFRPWSLDDRTLATSTIIKYFAGTETLDTQHHSRHIEKVAV